MSSDSAAAELAVTVATCVAFDLTLQISPTMTFYEKSSKKQRKLPFYRKKVRIQVTELTYFTRPFYFENTGFSWGKGDLKSNLYNHYIDFVDSST